MLAAPERRPFATLPLLAALLGGCAVDPVTGVEPVDVPVEEEPDEVVLTFAGDVHFTDRTAKLLDEPETAFGPVAELFAESDLAMLNLETAVTTRGTAEPKRYLFRAPPSAYQAVSAAGVDVVSLANNHALDYGRVGLADSLEHARSAEMPVVGAGESSDEAFAPWLMEVNDTTVAFLGISQVHELEESWSASPSRPGVAHTREPELAEAAVRDANRRADFVVVYMHWGAEGDDCPTAEMRSFARLLARAGADLIVGTHAHLLLGAGWLGDTYVAYGLGNFLWWWNDAYSNDTGVLRITLRDNEIAHTELVPAYISRRTGQPIPVRGDEAERIRAKFTGLRDCTGLTARGR